MHDVDAKLMALVLMNMLWLLAKFIMIATIVKANMLSSCVAGEAVYRVRFFFANRHLVVCSDSGAKKVMVLAIVSSVRKN